MSFLSGVLENLKSDELKTLEQYAQESGYIPRRSQDIESIRGFKQIAHQLDAFYAKGRYPVENGIPFFEFYSSRDSSKVACLHITYRNGNIPLVINLHPEFPEEIVEGIKREVQENSFVRIEGTTNDILVGEVIVDGEELLFSFKEI